jgi:large subunit ribosomal protein L18
MTAIAKKRIQSRKARHERVRKSVIGSPERPRLAVRRSLSNMVVQIIDDKNNKSLIQLTTTSKEFQEKFGKLNKTEQSKTLGGLIAEAAKAKGIESVVFDRGGYIYHGRVKALAEGARESGLQF